MTKTTDAIRNAIDADLTIVVDVCTVEHDERCASLLALAHTDEGTPDGDEHGPHELWTVVDYQPTNLPD